MSARALDDNEVLSEMAKMVAFIRQEAMEKAREIKVKADEEFAIEKAKLVKQEQQAIDSQFEKKRKGAEVAQKIAQSTITNKSRLKLLHKREEVLQQIFFAVREPSTPLSEQSGQYGQFLEGVITESLLHIMEPTVDVHCRKLDIQQVERAAANASAAYTNLSGFEISCNIHGSIPNDLCQGGVRLVSGNGRITLDNTLEERLRLLEDKMLPEIRYELFGHNPNRRFQS